MDYNNEESKLTINLKKENYKPEMLLEHTDVKSIRFDGYSDTIELPLELTDFKQLNTISVYSDNKEKAYNPPLNLEKFTQIKELTLWSFCDFEQLGPMPHIEVFNVVVRDPYKDTQSIVACFPNLKKLELWGSHLKNGELAPEIGELTQLEYLKLVSCGLSDLPGDFEKLSNLKELVIGGQPMRKFPEVICHLQGLENLKFSQHITQLPDNFSNLTSLRNLDFSHSFNNGTMSPVNDGFSDEKVYLHPIPEVIGDLPALEELNLDFCGVVDLAFLKNARKLRKFSAQCSGIENTAGLSHLKNLEELNLESASVLKNLDGLAGLPIKTLDVNTSRKLKSIDAILELHSLETLKISYCEKIKNLEAIYKHPTLKTLKASGEIEAQWKQKEMFANLPSVETVVENLESNDLKVVEKAINDLNLHVEKNFHDENNPLAGYFGEEADNYDMVHLPVLEEAFEKYKSEMSTETLQNLVGMSLRSVGEDNYQITVLAIEEMNRRKDVEAQKFVIEQFKKACEYYDFGHRYWENTVHDQLHDTLFPGFETEALLELLEDAHGDMLNSEGGDGADQLFIPAFKKCKSQDDFDRLLTAYLAYQEEYMEYKGYAYFKRLQEEIEEELKGDYLEVFQNEVAKASEQAGLYSLIESDDPNDMVKLIRMMGEKAYDDFMEANDYKIIRKMNDLDLPEEDVLFAINYFIGIKANLSDIADSLEKYVLPRGIEYLKAFLKEKEDKEYLADVIISMIKKMNKNGGSTEIIHHLRQYVKTIGNFTSDEIYAKEVKDLFAVIVDNRFEEKFDAYLMRLEHTVNLVENPPLQIPNLDFRFDLYLMASSEYWEQVKRVSTSMFKILPVKTIVNALYIPVVAAVKLKDEAFLKSLIPYIPEEIEEVLLTYNLACAFAVFNEKEYMLKYIKKSLELGKTSEQFMEDNDYALYWNDQDFLDVLA